MESSRSNSNEEPADISEGDLNRMNQAAAAAAFARLRAFPL
jgi:hypothetical protein